MDDFRLLAQSNAFYGRPESAIAFEANFDEYQQVFTPDYQVDFANSTMVVSCNRLQAIAAQKFEGNGFSVQTKASTMSMEQPHLYVPDYYRSCDHFLTDTS